MAEQAESVTSDNYEKGGIVGTTTSGSHRALPAVDGSPADPNKSETAYIQVYNISSSADLGDLQGSAKTVVTYHSHPEAIGFNQKPSEADFTIQRNNPTSSGHSYILSKREQQVYIYNSQKILTTFPMSQFKTVGK
jgi:proteasome lid subunit RPN8/RPN11